jgi:hypothetical protein
LPINKGDVPTWLYWLKRAVGAGIARVVQGKLPDKIEGKVKKTFVSNERTKDPKDKLIDRLTAILFSKLPASERRAVEEMLSEGE